MPQQRQGLPSLDELIPLTGGGPAPAPAPPAGGGGGGFGGLPSPQELVMRSESSEPSSLGRIAEGYLTGKGLMPQQIVQGVTGLINLAQNYEQIPQVAKSVLIDPAMKNLPRAYQAWKESQFDPRTAGTFGISPKTGMALAESLPLWGPGFTSARERIERGDELGGWSELAGNVGSLPKLGRILEQGALRGAENVAKNVPFVGPVAGRVVSAATSPLETTTQFTNRLLRGTTATEPAARTALENRLLFFPSSGAAKAESKIQEATNRAIDAASSQPGFGEIARSYVPEWMGGKPVTPALGTAKSGGPARVKRKNLYHGEESQQLFQELPPNQQYPAKQAWGQTRYQYDKPPTPEALIQSSANLLDESNALAGRTSPKGRAQSQMFGALASDFRNEAARVYPRTAEALQPIGPLAEAMQLVKGAPTTQFYPSASKYANIGRLALYGGLPLAQTFFSGAKKIDDNLIRAIVLSKLMEGQTPDER